MPNHGSSVNSENINGSRPLNKAAFGGHVQVALQLLKHGASAGNDGWTLPKAVSPFGDVDFFRLLLNHGVSVENTGNDVRTPLRVAASNVHLQVTQELLSNSGIVHIARKRELTAQLAAPDSDHVEVFREFLKHRACVVIVIKKFSEFLKAAAEKGQVAVVCELLMQYRPLALQLASLYCNSSSSDAVPATCLTVGITVLQQF
jgi:ankyrin repeat protein